MKEEQQKRFAVTRREFVVGTAATLAMISAGKTLQALEANQGGISATAFARARERAAKMAAQMNVDEMAGQLVNNSAALPKLGLARYNYWSEALHGVGVDGPITSFPQPIALGCSWNPDLVSRVYEAVGDEARAYHNQKGHGLTYFSPATVNMGLRDPRWGRVNENFSEDPLMVQQMGVRAIRGMQGDDPNYLKTVACAKHFICNETDSDRDYADAAPDHRSFWEYYVHGFEACVREGKAFSVMSAYNSLWGVPCSASSLLLTDILRKRWGFNGYVVSDCDAIADIYETHHYVEQPHEAAAVALQAGSDLNCGSTYSKHLARAVHDGLVPEAAMREAMVRVLTARVLLGEFDPAGSTPWDKLTAEALESRQHRELSAEAARQSLVLLKNDGKLLPLDKSKVRKVAVIGPMASSCFLGGYSGRSSSLVAPLEGIAEVYGEQLWTGKISAARFLSSSNFRNPVATYAEDGTEYLSLMRNNDWVQYGEFTLDGKTAIEFSYSAEAPGTIDVYFDSRSNAPAASLAVKATEGRLAWQTLSCALPSTTGRHTVLFRFRTESRKPFLHLASFAFTPADAASSRQHVLFAPGSPIIGPRNEALLRQAEDAARRADVALLFLGVNRLLSDEGRDRDSIDLPEVQHELAARVLAANPRTVVVINTCCPVAIEAEDEKAAAILCSYFAGEQQGRALADALFGNYNPGGKLCSTWYRAEHHLPNFHDYDIRHGRTYLYYRNEPLYPFGFGLSYTSFEYGNLQLNSTRFSAAKQLSVSVDVANSGDREGDEIVQLYVQAPGNDRPHRQLAAYERVKLAAGQKSSVRFSLPANHIALQAWDEKQQNYVSQVGKVHLMVGRSSANIVLEADAVLE